MTSKTPPVVDQVREGGLRYKSKKAGSSFAPAGGGSGFSGASMSCFKCGNHRPMFSLVNSKIMGINRRVCDGGCRKDEGA